MFQWTHDLAVGVEEIDRQHQELFRIFGDLISAMNDGKGREEIARTIGFLSDYVQNHFQEEETALEARANQDLPEHRYQHRTFLQHFNEIRREFEEQGGSSMLAIRIQQKLAGWLINHIAKLDRAAFQ